MHKNSVQRHRTDDSIAPNEQETDKNDIWDAFLADDDPEPLPDLHDFWIDWEA